ncbi:hypothetical protein CJF42_24450 [Pseudoalteromonas sp. NBT06-2]|uniref:hypothetical protein n=1 Tax=Pseudoalteromonas sp. NBT06-2 TaxID=2025950 RepID=UPI000BA7B585|nr:hypothetical protein [Pseudoalteromonas sp. NBT06-2]PAJ71855.1 hypothetical protein CJF42_24450 [Pseudoalteromonas sp. NBT06-2]
MNKVLSLTYVELNRRVIMFRRYPLNFFISILSSIFVLFGITETADYLSSNGLSSTSVTTVVVGYFSWIFSLGLTSTVSEDISEESKLGCFEHIATSIYSLSMIYTVRMVINVAYYLLGALIPLCVFVFLYSLPIYFPQLFGIHIILFLLTGVGISFTIGAVAVYNKRISLGLSLVQLGIIAIFFYPHELNSMLTNILPFAKVISIIKVEVLEPNLIVPISNYAISFVNALIYLALGLMLFNFSVNKCKKEGLLNEH